MKNNKGVTLVSLVVSVLVLAVLSSVTITLSLDALNTMKVQNFISQLKVIQARVDSFVEEGSEIEALGAKKLADIAATSQDDYDLFSQIIYSPDKYNINVNKSWNAELDGDINNYYYFTPQDLDEKLGLKNQEMTVIINFQTRNVITKDFVKEEDVRYYRQYDLGGAEELQTSEEILEGQYVLTYDANGGENAPTSANSYQKGELVLVDFSSIPTKEEYVFMGWATTKDATEPEYTQIEKNTFRIGKEDVTLYAVWDLAPLKVGDYVDYYPSGTYNWIAYYASSDLAVDGTQDIILGSGNAVVSANQDMTISKWRVFSIDQKTGNVELVPTAPTTNTVRLHGAQGYNNAVKLLNDACDGLYGNSAKGISARSINIEDIEERMTETALTEAHNTNNTNADTKYGEQVANAYTGNRNYPLIYAKEKLSVIDGIKNTIGLQSSEQTTLIGRTDEGAINGKLKASTSIQPYQTYWRATLTKSFKGEGTGSSNLNYNLILPAGTSSKYFVASRCISIAGDYCGFDVWGIYGGFMWADCIWSSSGAANTTIRALFPVVSLSSNLIAKNPSGGWIVK